MRGTQSGFDSLGGGLTAATLSGLFVAICLSQTGVAVLRRFMAQHCLRRGRGEATGAQCHACHGDWGNRRSLCFISRQCGVSGARSAGGDPACASGSSGHRNLAGDCSGRRHAADGGRDHGVDVRHHQCSDVDWSARLLCDGPPTALLPFRRQTQSAKVPASSLSLQGLWAALLVLPRTYDPATQAWGNLYSNLLEYVISAALIFYVLTVAGVFRLRIKRPDAAAAVPDDWISSGPGFLYSRRPAQFWPFCSHYRPATTWPGLLIVLLGIPVYSDCESGTKANRRPAFGP